MNALCVNTTGVLRTARPRRLLAKSRYTAYITPAPQPKNRPDAESLTPSSSRPGTRISAMPARPIASATYTTGSVFSLRMRGATNARYTGAR